MFLLPCQGAWLDTIMAPSISNESWTHPPVGKITRTQDHGTWRGEHDVGSSREQVAASSYSSRSASHQWYHSGGDGTYPTFNEVDQFLARLLRILFLSAHRFHTCVQSYIEAK